MQNGENESEAVYIEQLRNNLYKAPEEKENIGRSTRQLF